MAMFEKAGLNSYEEERVAKDYVAILTKKYDGTGEDLIVFIELLMQSKSFPWEATLQGLEMVKNSYGDLVDNVFLTEKIALATILAEQEKELPNTPLSEDEAEDLVLEEVEDEVQFWRPTDYSKQPMKTKEKITLLDMLQSSEKRKLGLQELKYKMRDFLTDTQVSIESSYELFKKTVGIEPDASLFTVIGAMFVALAYAIGELLFSVLRIPVKYLKLVKYDRKYTKLEEEVDSGKQEIWESILYWSLDILGDYGPLIFILPAIRGVMRAENFFGLPLLWLGILVVWFVITYYASNYNGRGHIRAIGNHYQKQGLSMNHAYREIPIALIEFFKEFEETYHVEIDRKRKIFLSEDSELGTTIEFYINSDKDMVIRSIEESSIGYFKIAPALNFEGTTATVANNRKVKIYLDQVLAMFNEIDMDMKQVYSKRPEYYMAFRELQAIYQQQQQEEAMKRQAEMARQQSMQEEQEREELLASIKEKGLNPKVVSALKVIEKNQEDWKFYAWDMFGKGIDGNQSYVKIRCGFLDGGDIKSVKALRTRMESLFRVQVMIKDVNDRGSFELILLYQTQLPSYSMSVEDVKNFNEKGLLYIGNSLTGHLSAKWNFQANHTLIAGMTGSGKSVQIKGILYQLANMEDYDYKTMYLTSSSKTSDFTPFKKRGALVAEGLEKQLRVFKYVLETLARREQIFSQNEIEGGIKEYNEKNPDNKMPFIVLLADEWENTFSNNDKKLAKEITAIMFEILNIARSSGCIVIVGAQSTLVGKIGITEKFQITFSGFNNPNVLNQISPDISNYYKTLPDKPQGVFFFNSINTKPESETINFGETTYTLIQTPYIPFESHDLPVLRGSEMEEKLFHDLVSTSYIEPEVEQDIEEENDFDNADFEVMDIGEL